MFESTIPVPSRTIPPTQLCSFMGQYLNQTVTIYEDGGKVKALYKGGVHPVLELLNTYPTARFVTFLTEMPHNFYIFAALCVKGLSELIVVA